MSDPGPGPGDEPRDAIKPAVLGSLPAEQSVDLGIWDVGEWVHIWVTADKAKRDTAYFDISRRIAAMPRDWRALTAPGRLPTTCATSSTVSRAKSRKKSTSRWSAVRR